MIKRTQVFIKQLVLFTDAVVITTVFFYTYFVRQQIHDFYPFDFITGQRVFGSLKSIESYLWLLWIILPVWTGLLHLMGAYRELRVKTFRQIAWILLKANLLGLVLFGAAVFVLKLHYVSRTFMVFFFVLSFCLLAIERFILIECWHWMARRDYFQRKFLVVGTGPRARKFIRSIQAHTRWGLQLVGLMDLDPKLVGSSVHGVKVIGILDDLPQFLHQEAIDEVVFVVPRSWVNRIEEAILYCERVGVRATVAADFFNLNFAKAHPSDFEGIPTISFDTTPADQWQLAIKRLGDIVISLVGLIVLLPFFPIVALLSKATSPGPVFFRQLRCGVNGRRFTLYKFRSMVVDAEARLAGLNHLNELNGPVFKAENDPRLTPLGRWLRKTSVDELPQLFNVLKGEMSLVGPRPPLPHEVAQYESWQLRRLSMRPGITGYWQVNGRNQIKDFNRWVQYDLDYIDHWSLALDLKILLKTIPATLLTTGAK